MPHTIFTSQGKLSRRGLISAGNCFTPGLIDNLTYSYGDEGRLTAVSDAALEPYRQEGFKPGAEGGPQATHYQYDHNGNLTSDAHKNMQFNYNFLNLPLNITTPLLLRSHLRASADAKGELHYLYDATGRKWAKSGPDGIRFYAGNIEYLDGKVQHIAFPDGRLVAEYNTSGTSVTGYRSEYFRTDHLGNTRLTFSDFNQDGMISWKLPTSGPSAQESEITSENHYYPFGLSQKGPWYASVAPENKYRYNGKEWNDDWGLNMYDYGARGYMPDLGRWGGVDALAEQSEQVDKSPYSAFWNNPIKYDDPDGRCPRCLKALLKTAVKSVIKGKVDLGEVYDAIDAVKTIANPEASLLDKGLAVFDLISPVSSKELKAGTKLLGVSDDANNVKKAVNNTIDSVKNPYGSKGKPDHQAKVDDLAGKAKSENPEMIILTEKKLQGHDSNRRPDVQVVDPNTNKATKVYEAERRPTSTRNKNREDEYKRLNIPNETHKVGN